MRNLRVNIRTHELDLIFLSQTLLSNVKNSSVANRLGFSLFVNTPPSGKWGGLVYMDNDVMAILVYLDPLHNPWLINLVYCIVQSDLKWKFRAT